MGVIDEAQKWIGKVQYVFGGDNIPGGTGDCSSFVQYVFRQNGMEIGRTTFDQIQHGTEIGKNQIQPGDLVFFQGTYNTSGPSHVGISLGGTKFIDLGSTGVRVSDFGSGYWAEHYMTARRIEGTPVGNVGNGTDFFNPKPSGNWLMGDSGGGFWATIGTFIILLIAVLSGVFFFAKAFGFSLNPLS